MKKYPQKILVTGGTGCLGSDVMQSVFMEHPCGILLGRHAPVFDLPIGWQFVKSDMAKPNLGIQDPKALMQDVTHVIHMAADVRWNLSVETSIQCNVAPTQQLIDWVEHYCHNLVQFVYVSTAYVDAISHQKKSLHPFGPESFNNTYEYSKFLSESCLTLSRIPWTIIRPSIIIGRSDNGYISHFNGLYQVVKMLATGKMPFIIGGQESCLDVVPVDLVSESILWSLAQPSQAIGRHAYCSSGQHSPKVMPLGQTVMNVLNARRLSHRLGELPELSLVNADTFERLFMPLFSEKLPPVYRRVLETIKHFIPYFSINEPRQFSKEEKVFLCDKPLNAMVPSLDYWCSKHDKLMNVYG